MNNISVIREHITLIVKGLAMGAANVIPGVSGGTIALISGIFERLIQALKSINLTAAGYLFSGKWKSFARHIQLNFLLAVFSGVFISIFSIAKLLKYLFETHPVLIWAFFFGLIMASVFYVGRTISSWTISVILLSLLGVAIAIGITLFTPAQENTQIYYLMICGVVAVCSMILPGLSGSFVLILLGNYELIMINAVSDLNWGILLPVGIGAIVGLLAFSHLLFWIFKRFKDQTIGILTGFMAGSLLILWPWKEDILRTDSVGNTLLNRSGEPVLEGYSYLVPDFHNQEFWFAIICVLLGITCIALVEWQGKKTKSK